MGVEWDFKKIFEWITFIYMKENTPVISVPLSKVIYFILYVFSIFFYFILQ